MVITWVDPESLKLVHEPGDEKRVRALIAGMRAEGWKGRPLLACELYRGAYQALTGCHRIDAAFYAQLRAVPVHILRRPRIAKAAKETGKAIDAIIYDLKDTRGDTERLRKLKAYGFHSAARLLEEEISVNNRDAASVPSSES